MMAKRRVAFYLMTIPALLLFFAFHTFPALQGIYYSFTNWDGFSDSFDYVGFKNFINIFQDENVLNSYVFTFKYAILTTILINIISLLIALGLNAKIKAKNFFRGVYFLPNILSVLIVGFIFNYLFANVFPIWGEKLGSEFLSQNILGNSDWAWIGIVIVAVWQGIAYNTILYLAGLQTIPQDLYEASNLDGASLERILEYYFSNACFLLHDQHGAGDEGRLNGIRPNRSLDRWGTWTFNTIHCPLNLYRRLPRRRICLSIGERRDLFYRDRCDLRPSA